MEIGSLPGAAVVADAVQHGGVVAQTSGEEVARSLPQKVRTCHGREVLDDSPST